MDVAGQPVLHGPSCPRLDVVLVRPARATNVAAACRALANMGFEHLRLVGPLPDLADPAARALAYGAWELLDGAVACDSLADAVADAEWVVGTSGKPQAGALDPRAFARRLAGDGRGRVALVFGPEASGLTRRELDLCHARVHIPAAPAHPSLNLAQAVLILAYESFLALGARDSAARHDEPAAASAGEMEDALAHLREALLEVGFLDPRNPDAILSELRRLLARAAPTPRELLLLRGLARQVGWAGRVARGRCDDR
jgi:TrmH family RNA methyltransferase